MSGENFNISVEGNNNDTDLILQSTSGSIAESANTNLTLERKINDLEKGLDLNSANDLLQNELIASNTGGVSSNASGVATNLSRLDAHEALVLKNIADISANKARLDLHEGLVTKNIEDISKLHEKVTTNEETLSMHNDKLLDLNNNKLDISPNISVLQVKSLYDNSDIQETFTANNNKWKLNSLTNELNYDGIQTNNLGSFISNKQYTITGGFNFSCKVSLSDSHGNGAVLGYNASVDASGIVAGYPTIDASGTTEMEIVMVKDQDSSKVRVWKNGVEDDTNVYPKFTGGRLVVLANPNATFSEIKLTDTNVDFGISSILDNFTHLQFATFQSTNPITQQNVDDYDKVNVIIQNEQLRNNPNKDFSSAGYILKLGAAHYYQIVPIDSIDEIVSTLTRYGNGVVGVDLILGGSGDGTTFFAKAQNLISRADKSVTLSLKYYSKDVAYLRERLKVTEEGSPLITWNDLTPATQNLIIQGFKATLPPGATVPDSTIITLLTNQVNNSLINNILLIPYGSRPLQSAPEFINYADNAIVNITNPNGNLTAQHIESYKQLSAKLADFNYTIDGANTTVTNNASFASAESVKNALLTEFGAQFPYQIADLVPSVGQTNSWILNTLDKSTLETVITDPNSFATYAEYQAVGLSALADQFVAVLEQGSPGNGQTIFDSLSYKTFAETFLLQTALTGKTITINDLNGDYTPNMSSLLPGDEQKFRQALAMKESADVESALTIPEPDRFFYLVYGLSPNSTTTPVTWNYIATLRNDNSVWTYVRVIDRNLGSYVDADSRTESAATIYQNTTNIPGNVITAFNTFYSFTLDDNSLMGYKYLVRYSGALEYYFYADMTTTVPTVYVLFSPLDPTITDDADRTWLDMITLSKGFYQQFGQTPPLDDKLDYKVYKTWAEVEARLSYLNDKYSTLITPTYSTNVIDTNLQGIIGTGDSRQVDITKAGAYPITYNSGSDLRILAVGAEKWWENTLTLTDTSKDYDINALVVSHDGQTIAFCRGQYSPVSEGRQPGEQKVFVMKKGENVPIEIILPTTSGFTIGLFSTARGIQRLKLNNDGTVLLISEWFDGNLSGDVLVYRKTGSSWNLAAEMDTLSNAKPEGPQSGFGGGADMSDDGNVVVGGSYFGPGIQVMRWDGTNYVIEAVDSSSNSIGRQGKDVKISSDGTEIIMPITDNKGTPTDPSDDTKHLLLLKKDSTTDEWKDHSYVGFETMIWGKQLHYVSSGVKRLLVGTNNSNNIDIYKIDVAGDGTFSVPELVRTDLVAEDSTLLSRFVVGVANAGKLILINKTLADGTIILEKLQTSGDQFDSTAIYESTIIGTFKLSQFAVSTPFGPEPTVFTRGSKGQPLSLNSLVVPSGDATSVLTLLKVQDSNVKRNVVLEYPLAPNIVDLDDLVSTISAQGGALELSANESYYYNIAILPPLYPSPRDFRALNIIRLPNDLSTLNSYTGAIGFQHRFNPVNGSLISSNLLEYDDMRYTTDKANVLNSFKATLAAISGGIIDVDAILDSGKGLYGQQTVASGNPRVYTWLFDLRDPSIPKAEVLIYAPTATGGSIETFPSNDWLKDTDLTQVAQNATNSFLQDPTQFAGLFAPGVFPTPVTGTALNNSQVVSGLIQAFLSTNPSAQQEWTNYIASLGENPLVEYNALYSSLENMRIAFQSRSQAENTIDSIFDITS